MTAHVTSSVAGLSLPAGLASDITAAALDAQIAALEAQLAGNPAHACGMTSSARPCGTRSSGRAARSKGPLATTGAGIQNEYAEWNIYVDPTAANIVFHSGIPIILVPLDATREVPVTRDFYRALAKNRDTSSANLVYEMLTANLDFVDSGGFQFWDSLTAAISTDSSIATYEEMEITVVEEEGPESGRTKPATDGAKIKVAISADRKTFEQILLTIFNWRKN